MYNDSRTLVVNFVKQETWTKKLPLQQRYRRFTYCDWR